MTIRTYLALEQFANSYGVTKRELIEQLVTHGEKFLKASDLIVLKRRGICW